MAIALGLGAVYTGLDSVRDIAETYAPLILLTVIAVAIWMYYRTLRREAWSAMRN